MTDLSERRNQIERPDDPERPGPEPQPREPQSQDEQAPGSQSPGDASALRLRLLIGIGTELGVIAAAWLVVLVQAVTEGVGYTVGALLGGGAVALVHAIPLAVLVSPVYALEWLDE
jgi:hypothetical protein